jgi:hypothetical protein
MLNHNHYNVGCFDNEISIETIIWSNLHFIFFTPMACGLQYFVEALKNGDECFGLTYWFILITSSGNQ